MSGGGAMARGVLVRWNDERGFGFLRPLEGEGAEVFAHISAFGSRDGRPRDGEVFDYEFAAAQDGRLRATRVCPVAGWPGSSMPATSGPRP